MVIDMDEHGTMRSDAMEWAKEILGAEGVKEEAAAKQIKQRFDKTYGPTWHCIVGSEFRA